MLKVAELQNYLGHLTPLAKAAGASAKVVEDFERVLRCLEPFKEKSLAEFSEFLQRADEFDRTGKLSAPAAPRRSRSTATKTPGLTVDEAAEVFRNLHARATDPALSYADIDGEMKRLEKLTIAQLREVAAKVSVTVPSKGKKQILEELTRRIKELKASHERTQFHFGETA